MTTCRHIVYIIGFMGSGKTTAGRKLADKLGWAFIDLDKKIEEFSGQTISVIFSKNGEPYFREVESKVLRELQIDDDTVISTGGGTPCFNDNMDFMLHNGITVYLKLTPSALISRLSNSMDRPLIADLKGKKLLDFITEKLNLREKDYLRSDLCVDGIDLDLSRIALFVKSKLNR